MNNNLQHMSITKFNHENEIENINGILLDCYSSNQPVIISYYKRGRMSMYCGVIKKIDILKQQIILLPKKKFKINYITEIFKIN